MSVLHDVGAVVIGRNEGDRLARCLRSIIGKVDRVVYVDSGSTDGSVELARSLDVDVVELDLSRPFTAARARNEGLSRLREIMGSPVFVQFVDGDCEVNETWCEQARSALSKDTSLAVVCGRRRERRPEASVYNLLCDLEWDTPVGLADSCGGDAMMRISALEQVNGYDETVIAGEEPELCFRLRRRGLRVRRIDAEMTLHDAAMTSFSQWWTRAKRAGHACAEGAWRHGRSVERFNVRRLARVAGWGGVLPVTILALGLFWHWLWLGALAVYVVQFWRIRAQQMSRGRAQRAAEAYAFFTVLDKLPALVGACRFFFGKLTRRESRIIEYKDVSPEKIQAHTCSIAYVAPVLPALSETFVYREIFALEELGVRIVPVSVRAGTESLTPSLESLRDRAVDVYGAGWGRLGLDALLEMVTHPMRGVDTIALATRDLIVGSDLDGKPRWKIAAQCLAALALARRLRPHGVIRLHAHFAHVPATIAMYAARQLGGCFSFTGHANDLFRERTLLAEKLERADRVMCISDWHRELYQQVAPVDGGKLSVVRCAVDMRSFDPGTGGGADVLSVGRLVEKKGLATLVQAIAVLREQGVDLTCQIVGEGPQRRELEALIETLDVSDRVSLLGAKDNDDVRELMGRASLFVLACQPDAAGDRDGIPVVLMEAMATSLCVVAGDLPAIRELVIDGETGVMVAPGDVDELVDVLGSLCADRGRAKRLGERGRSRVREEFSREVNVLRLLEAFGVAPPDKTLAFTRDEMLDAPAESRRMRA